MLERLRTPWRQTIVPIKPSIALDGDGVDRPHHIRTISLPAYEVENTQNSKHGSDTSGNARDMMTAESLDAAALNTREAVPDSRPTVVCLHGLGGSASSWVPNLDALAEHYTVHAVDLPGFAASSRPVFGTRDPAELETRIVAALEAWRVAHGLERFVIMGHSFGGYLAAAYALRHPQHVAHLVLVDPWGFSRHASLIKPGQGEVATTGTVAGTAAAPPGSEAEAVAAAAAVGVPAPGTADGDGNSDDEPVQTRRPFRLNFMLRGVAKVLSFFPPYAILR